MVAFSTLVSTTLGGLFALRFKDKLHLILGFSAGAVLAVAFFDLMPESIRLMSPAYAINTSVTIIAIGFIAYLVVDRTMNRHSHRDGDRGGNLGVGSLASHSFLDGFAIGIGFQVSANVGMMIAVAVLVHDFSDGINTVGLVLRSGGSKKHALRWLTIDAVAPVLGVLLGSLCSLSERALGIVLGLFCGFFLYIGACDLIPESHHIHPKKITTVMTVLGLAVLYFAIRLSS